MFHPVQEGQDEPDRAPGPRLDLRTSLVIAGADVASSPLHLVYIALEAVKIVLLNGAGIVLITSAP